MNSFFLYLPPLITFSLVTSGIMYVYYQFEKRRRRAVLTYRMFGSREESEEYKNQKPPSFSNLRRMLIFLGVAATPRKTDELIDIKKLLTWAGYRNFDAVSIYYGIRLGAGLGFALFFLLNAIGNGSFQPTDLMYAIFPMAGGYYLPGLILNRKIRLRQQKIFKELPDTLDLILVCIEAGLSFDMALYRISRELFDIAPVLSKEFAQYFFEVQGGLPREEALLNLSKRNGEKSLISVVNVLIQSAKFGTDITHALRVYSDSLRTERKQMAEEKTQTVSTKLTLPLILLIMPALLIVIIGPALINLVERLKGFY